jgi:hypothetical protein
MKLITIALLVAVLMAQSGAKTAMYMVFLSNRAVIAEQQCEKRNEPGNCCQGNCVLRKALADASSHGQPFSLPASWKEVKEWMAVTETPTAVVLAFEAHSVQHGFIPNACPEQPFIPVVVPPPVVA